MKYTVYLLHAVKKVKQWGFAMKLLRKEVTEEY